MPKEITENTKSEIIYYLLSGYSYSEIIDLIQTSKGTITKVVRQLKTKFGEDDIEFLLNFAKSLKKNHLAMSDTLNGTRVYAILKKLSLDEEYVQEFLNKIVFQCKSQNFSPDDLTKYSMMLFELSQSSEIPLPQLENHYFSLIQKNKEIQNSITSSEKKQKEAKTRLDESLHHEKTTIESLNDYSVTKKRLGEFNIDIDNLDSLVVMLQESSKLNFDPYKVIQYIKKESSFETRIDLLQKDIDKMDNTVQQKQNELTRIQSDIDELKLQKEQLTAQNKSLQDQIKFSKETTLSTLTKIKDSSVSAIDLTAKSAKDSIVSTNETAQKEMKQTTDTAKSNFKEITADFESLLSKVSDASTEIGKMQALMPLYLMITQLKGDTIPVYVSLLSMFDSLLIWEKTHHVPIGMNKHINYLQNILREYLAKQ
ncbi:hypothetical protein [Nitrosopumilus sp. Nsub]|uniref:coiled-coil domain-containing protein n=1 Tax=Nitrosopumilus sp. Nsub TaxID=1776294 RepID=UPI00082E9C52|nr:hypothetical protein [Nitrosopumilus sp. Nsub]